MVTKTTKLLIKNGGAHYIWPSMLLKHTQANLRPSLHGKDLLQSVHYKPTIIRTDSESMPEILVRDVTGTSFAR
jgi:hypothetical protein